MQKGILEKYPSSRVRVYTVWFSMTLTDGRPAWRWTSHVITDSRVEHFWDDKKVVGRWFARYESPAESEPGIVWDAYFLFGPGAQWDAKPEPLISWGATVHDQYGELEKNLVPLLAEKAEKR